MIITLKHTNGGTTTFYNATLITEGDTDVKVCQDGYVLNKYGEEEYEEDVYTFSKNKLVYVEIEEDGEAIRLYY